MFLDKRSEKKWLIKSENKIVGPYSFDEILDLLRKRQVSIIDEVRDPETRWLYVRENSEFKDIVEEIRKEIDSRQESTKTYQTAVTATSAVNQNTSITNSTGNPALDDIFQKTKTDIPAYQNDHRPSPQDVEVISESTQPRADHFAKPRSTEKAKIYGVQTDSVVQKRMSDFSDRLRIGVIVIVLLVIGAYGGYTYLQQRNVIKKEVELVLKVKKLKYEGLYDKAAELYFQLPEANRNELLPQMLDIFPVLQRVGGISFDRANSLIRTSGNLSGDQRATLELIQFWLAVKEQNYGQAQDFIVKAKSAQPGSQLIMENDAWLSLKRMQPQDAYKQFTDLYTNQKNNGRYLYGRFVSYLGLPENEKTLVANDLLSDIDRYTIIYVNLRKELLLAQIYLAQELKNESIYNLSLKQFFNTPTQLAQLFIKPSLMMPDAYTWKELDAAKQAVQSRLAGDDLLLFQFHDMLERGALNEATQFTGTNLQKISNPAIKAEVQLLMLHAQGRAREVAAFAQTGGLDMNSEINHFILAYNKIKEDPTQDLQNHLDFLDKKEQDFFKKWLEIERLSSREAVNELRNYLNSNAETMTNFIPVVEARMKVSQ